MNQRIAFIITTDFVCWVPFIIICILHSAEVLDGTPWYSIFSIFFLPLNSVINPLIYDDTVTNLIAAPVKKIANLVSGSAVFQSLRDRWSSAKQEDIELEHVVQVQDGEAAGTIAEAESEKRKREGVLSDAPVGSVPIKKAGRITSEITEEDFAIESHTWNISRE